MKDKLQAFWDKRGFSVVLCCCFLIVGLVAFYTRTVEEPQAAPPELTVYPTATPIPVPAAAQTVTILPTATPLPLSPVSESIEVGMEYSGDQLVYNKTLDEWRQHGGVDYLGAEDSPVRAVLGGRVNKIYLDSYLGQCVEISSSDGFRCLYASLGEDLLVEVGSAVSPGQTIGFMGQSALCERDEGFHVHVELYKDDRCLCAQLPLS